MLTQTVEEMYTLLRSMACVDLSRDLSDSVKLVGTISCLYKKAHFVLILALALNHVTFCLLQQVLPHGH